MKVLLDTNIYIGWIREKKYKDILLNPYTIKYMSPIVLMELWAGAKTKHGIRMISKLQEPYRSAKRIVHLTSNNYILAGQILSDFPVTYRTKIKQSSFINDLLIAINSVSIGAILHTSNKDDFNLINKFFPKLKVYYID